MDDWGSWIAWTPHVELELRDCWVGVYWDRKTEGDTEMVDVYVCIIPWFPIHFHFEREEV